VIGRNALRAFLPTVFPLWPHSMRAIQIHKQIVGEMMSAAQLVPLEECCGLLAGLDGVISRVFAATNAASDPTKNYEIAPKELFRLMREIRAAKLELLGIYHSHPKGKNEPSARDIELAYYPGTPYFILSPLPDVARLVRAFTIRDVGSTELEIQII
jgi:proteasome lid subunit RPN8/RPN11